MRQGVKSDREEGSVGVERVIELRRTLPFRNSIYDIPITKLLNCSPHPGKRTDIWDPRISRTG